jgi:alkylation response protein AidB-like acyl-CoA dehydrogenase
MDFRFTAEDEAFRKEVRDFIKGELPQEWHDRAGEGYGLDDRSWHMVRDFQGKLAKKKWLAMAWPEEYGGLNASHMKQLIYNEEMTYNAAPGSGGNMGVMWVGPSLMLYGTDEQKAKFIPRITSAEDWWCTLYSEPAAGSDLAALQTRAVRDGDDYVVNGQKIWTSGAHRSDWGWLAARTDPEAPKHKGISMFVVDMKSPGISIRPLINIAGQHGFNEVFFDNVRIPKENLVGEENRGWYHMAVALDFERSGIAAFANGRRSVERLAKYAVENPALIEKRPSIRYELADRAIDVNTGTFLAYRIVHMQSRGIIPNYEASVSKMFGSEMSQRIALTAMHLLGLHGELTPGSPQAMLRGAQASGYMTAVSATIAAGTSEIQRGIISQRGLGLPRG